MRKCHICGWTVENPGMVDGVTAELYFMSEHLNEHNPSPAQWAEAYNKILKGRANAKRKESGAGD